MRACPSEGIQITTPEKTEYVPLEFGSVLGTSLRYWWKNLKSYWSLYFSLQLVIITIAYGAFFLSGGDFTVAQMAGNLGALIPFWLITSFFLTPLSLGLTIVLVVIIIFQLILQVILGGMVIHSTALHHAKLAPTLGGSYEHARSHFWSLLGAQILLVIIIVGIGLGSGLLIVLLSAGFLLVMGFFGMFIGLILALVVMIILIVYVTVRLTVAIPSVILGGEGAVGSISRSWQLTGGNFWRIIAIIIVIVIISFAIGIPTSIASSVIYFGLFNPTLTIVGIITHTIVSAVIVGFTTPLGNTTSTMIYHDLMGRQYGGYQPGVPKRIHTYTECPVCKRPVSPDERFCGQCGRELDID
ncbi:MAG: glycerophosphoryl diester phosphodiesterase membrane domain-containing protein [Promethearchaeota archaeon]